MKSLIFALSLFFAGTAGAAIDFEAVSWSTILRSAQYEPDYTNKIHFQEASSWVNSWSNRLCTDGRYIYGGTVVKTYCNDSGSNCTSTTEALIQPIVSQRQRCAASSGDECTEYESVAYIQSPRRQIRIYRDGDQDDTSPLGVKSYTIPSCNN